MLPRAALIPPYKNRIYPYAHIMPPKVIMAERPQTLKEFEIEILLLKI
jgi:hypothetical protein